MLSTHPKSPAKSSAIERITITDISTKAMVRDLDPDVVADKRAAVLVLLTDEDWRSWPNRRIARHVGVTHPFVGKLRTELAAAGNGYQSAGADGRVIDTTRIGSTATVLDLFAGSGTTLETAVQHGRRAVGIELNSKYADGARERLAAVNPADVPPDLWLEMGDVPGDAASKKAA